MKIRNTVTERRYQRANAMQVGRALASVDQVLASMKVLTDTAHHLPFGTREAIRVAMLMLQGVEQQAWQAWDTAQKAIK